MIYTDRIHIVSDKSLEELHRFAKNIGLNYCWFDSNPKHPHYDFPLTRSSGLPREKLIELAIDHGAHEVESKKELVIACRNLLENNLKRFH